MIGQSGDLPACLPTKRAAAAARPVNKANSIRWALVNEDNYGAGFAGQIDWSSGKWPSCWWLSAQPSFLAGASIWHLTIVLSQVVLLSIIFSAIWPNTCRLMYQKVANKSEHKSLWENVVPVNETSFCVKWTFNVQLFRRTKHWPQWWAYMCRIVCSQ